MKINFRGMVFVCLMAMIFTSQLSFAEESNVLLNGSFENAIPGKIKPKDTIEGWKLVSGKAAKAHFYIVESLENPEEQALKINIRNPGFKPWSIRAVQNNIYVQPGVEYQFKAKVAGPEGTRVAMFVQTPEIKRIAGERIDLDDQPGYQEISFNFTPEYNEETGYDGSEIRLAIRTGFKRNRHREIVLDDISITPINISPPPVPTIVNGDFETGELYVISQGQDQIALPWIVNSAEPGVIYQLVDAPFNEGGQSMMVQVLSESLNPAIVDAEANGNSSPWFIQLFQQSIEVVPGNNYELRARVYGQAGTMMAAFAQAGDPTYSTYGQAYFEFPDTLNQFVDLVIPFTPFDDGSNNGYHANIAFHFGFSQNFDKYFYIDDVDVVLISDNCDSAVMDCTPGGGGNNGGMGIERVENGGFDFAILGEISNGTDGIEVAQAWSLTANGSQANYSVIENPSNGGDNALQVEIVNVDPASNPWDLQVAQTTVPVVPRVEHLLEFNIDGTAFTQVTIWAQSPAPYYQGFNSMTIQLDDQPGFETYSMFFTPSAIADDYDGSVLQLAFHFSQEGNTGNTILIDNVSIRAFSDTPPPEVELPPQALSEPALHTLVDFPLGLAVGSAGNSNDIMSGSVLAERRRNVITHHFNSVVAENIMKPYALHPEPDSFNWFEVNELVSFTQENSLQLHGHTLIWHQQNPGWMETFTGTQDEWIGMMASHITGSMINFVDDVQSWDVVNEAFNEDGSYRESFWLNGMGEGYIEYAFNLARNVSSETDLYYNDYNLAANDGKLAGVLVMADDFLARGVPLDGIGFQMHVTATWPSIENIRASFAAVAARGLKVRISELDLNINGAGNFSELTPEAEAIQFNRFREIAIAYREMVPSELRGGITIWGTNDSDNWIAINARQNGSAPEWPTLFDDALNEKAAFDGFKEGLTVELE